MNPEVQWLKQSKSPVQVQVAKVSAVDIIQQVTQQLTPLVVAIPQVKAGLQCEQAGPAGDEVVGVVVDPGFPPFELPVGNKQPLLTQVEDAATGIVCHPPQLPGADDAAPAQAHQSTAAFIHLAEEGKDVQLALNRQEGEREVVLNRLPPAAYRDQGSLSR